MAAASLALSIVALLVAGGSLAWTVYEWRNSGAKLKVKATSFVLLGRSSALLGEVPDRWLIAIEVTNVGRTATTVQTVGFKRAAKKGVLIVPDPEVGPERLPKRLAPGESFNWPIDPVDVLECCKREGEKPSTLRPYANSGHGLFSGIFDKAGLGVLAHRNV